MGKLGERVGGVREKGRAGGFLSGNYWDESSRGRDATGFSSTAGLSSGSLPFFDRIHPIPVTSSTDPTLPPILRR